MHCTELDEAVQVIVAMPSKVFSIHCKQKSFQNICEVLIFNKL